MLKISYLEILVYCNIEVAGVKVNKSDIITNAPCIIQLNRKNICAGNHKNESPQRYSEPGNERPK